MTLYGGSWSEFSGRYPWDPYYTEYLAGTLPASMSRPFLSVVGVHLLPDASVLFNCVRAWFRLRPDRQGNYATGTWERVNRRSTLGTYYSAAALADGRLLTWYSEFVATGSSKLVEVFDPVADTWTTKTPTWSNFAKFDVPGTILADGRVLIGTGGKDVTPATAWTDRGMIYNPSTDAWVATGNFIAGAHALESGFVQRQDGKVVNFPLDRQVTVFGNVSYQHDPQLYDPNTNAWTATATVSAISADPNLGYATFDQGPLLTLHNGTVMALGNYNGRTARFDISQGLGGSWDTTLQMPAVGGQGGRAGAMDTPACILPNGNWLVSGGEFLTSDVWCFPTRIMEFDHSTFSELADQPAVGVDGYTDWMVPLPNGQVMLKKGARLYFFTPTNVTAPTGKAPVITEIRNNNVVVTTLPANTTLTVRGTRLNGVSLGVGMKDEKSTNCNFPIVSLRYGDGTTVYCPTKNVRRQSDGTPYMGLDPNAVTMADFTIPLDAPNGLATLFVTAHGFKSAGKTVTVTDAGQPYRTPLTVTGGVGEAYSDGAGGYFYDGVMTQYRQMPSFPTTHILTSVYRNPSIVATGGTAPYTYEVTGHTPLPAGVKAYVTHQGVGLVGAPNSPPVPPADDVSGFSAGYYECVTIKVTDAVGAVGYGHFLFEAQTGSPISWAQDYAAMSDTITVVHTPGGGGTSGTAGKSDAANLVDTITQTADYVRSLGFRQSRLD